MCLDVNKSQWYYYIIDPWPSFLALHLQSFSSPSFQLHTAPPFLSPPFCPPLRNTSILYHFYPFTHTPLLSSALPTGDHVSGRRHHRAHGDGWQHRNSESHRQGDQWEKEHTRPTSHLHTHSHTQDTHAHIVTHTHTLSRRHTLSRMHSLHLICARTLYYLRAPCHTWTHLVSHIHNISHVLTLKQILFLPPLSPFLPSLSPSPPFFILPSPPTSPSHLNSSSNLPYTHSLLPDNLLLLLHLSFHISYPLFSFLLMSFYVIPSPSLFLSPLPKPPSPSLLFLSSLLSQECGILTEGGVAMEGPAFRNLTPAQLDAIIPTLQVRLRIESEEDSVEHIKINWSLIFTTVILITISFLWVIVIRRAAQHCATRWCALYIVYKVATIFALFTALHLSSTLLFLAIKSSSHHPLSPLSLTHNPTPSLPLTISHHSLPSYPLPLSPTIPHHPSPSPPQSLPILPKGSCQIISRRQTHLGVSSKRKCPPC